MRRLSSVSWMVGLALLGPGAGARAAEPLPGQVPLLIVGDQFRFVHGSWARYRLHNKQDKSESVFSIAILGQETKKGILGSWMEIGVSAPNTPRVLTRYLTRYLAEETPQGPGRLLAAVVDVEGLGPFSVPAKFMEGEEAQVGKNQAVKPVKRMARGPWTRANKTVNALDVEANDEAGRPVQLLFSEEVPPLGILNVRTADVEMEIQDWGTGAQSQITGKPLNFYLWLFKQVGRAVSEGEAQATAPER